MSLTKVDYVEDTTVIHANNLNDIQDEIINECVSSTSKTFTSAKKNAARSTIGIPNVSSGTTLALADLQATVLGTF